MDPRSTRRVPRIASALAVVAGIANVLSQALASTELCESAYCLGAIE